MDSAEYVPYGPEWEEEMARLKKAPIIEMMRMAGMERDRLRDALAEAREWARKIYYETSGVTIAEWASHIWTLANDSLGDVATAVNNDRGAAPNPREEERHG